tara:strand:+ start:63 stop:902 length:840 start_codon:yes stop_codon:yes gene_type:complete
MLDIILCVYNSSDTIEECIDSILDQTYEKFNLYIFDDCSSDDTIEKIKEYKDNRITLIHSKTNIGTYAAKNFVLKNYCKSEYVALHDADDYSEPRRLEKQLGFAILSGPACVGTTVREFWENQEPHTTSDQLTKNKERINSYPVMLDYNSLFDLVDEHKIKYNEFFKFKICMNGTVMFMREILNEIGGWDGKTRIGGDTDIFIRLMSKYKIYNIPDCLYNRRFHKKSLTASDNTGIDSDLRKKYIYGLYEVVKSSLEKQMIVRNFYYPEFEYEIIKCAE